MFRGGTGRGGVLEETANSELGEHLLLDAMKYFREVDLAGVRCAWHR